MRIQVDKDTSLEMLQVIHAESLFNLVNANRDHLRTWLPWVDQMKTVANFRHHIIETNKRAADRTDFGFAIVIDRNIVGRMGLHNINHHNKIGEIGYWLAADMQGKGIVSRCCTSLITHAFTVLGLNRIEIKCGTGNLKSKCIPEKLGFKEEGILRQAEWLNGSFIDLYLFSMLKEEWLNRTF
jgi:ribosomal-protein-serine acetyltransferase